MWDIALVGNLIFDKIYEVSSYPKENSSNVCLKTSVNFGAIANVYKSFPKKLKVGIIGHVGNDLEGNAFINTAFASSDVTHIKKTSESTSSAVIVSNIESSTRTSIVDWSACTNLTGIDSFSARWTHVSYLDALPKLTEEDLKVLRANSKVLSADLCKNQHSLAEIAKIFSSLKYFDFLIISDTEAISLQNANPEYLAILQATLSEGAIIHSKSETILVRKGSIQPIKNPTKELKNVNVLGAGDVFCGHLIANLYSKTNMNDETLIDAILNSHSETFKYIEMGNKNEKI